MPAPKHSVEVQRSIGLKGYANQYKVVLGTSAIILMSSWEIGSSLGGLSASLFSFLTPVTRSLLQHEIAHESCFKWWVTNEVVELHFHIWNYILNIVG